MRPEAVLRQAHDLDSDLVQVFASSWVVKHLGELFGVVQSSVGPRKGRFVTCSLG